MEKAGKPTVTLSTQFFAPLAAATARGKGMPGIPQVILPHPYDTLPAERIVELAHQYIDEVVSKLTDAGPRGGQGGA